MRLSAKQQQLVESARERGYIERPDGPMAMQASEAWFRECEATGRTYAHLSWSKARKTAIGWVDLIASPD